MPLPKSIGKLKNLGRLTDECVISDVKFMLRSLDTKEFNEILATTAHITDGTLRVELLKQKTLEVVITSVDNEPIQDPAELIEYLKGCNPTIINTLFQHYIDVADKAAAVVSDSIAKVTLSETNLPDIAGKPVTE